MDPTTLTNLDDFEKAAVGTMPQMSYDYIAGGSDDERTLRDNRAAFARWRMRPRMFRGVGTRSLETTVLGHKLAFPVGVAPSAMHQLAHPDGEVATARAAGNAGALLVVSTLASKRLEDISAAATGPRWFQLYWYKDKELTRDLFERARDANYTAIVLTADAPVLGRRERDIRNQFAPPPDVKLRNFETEESSTLKVGGAGSSLGNYVSAQAEPNLTWKDVEWLAATCQLPVLVKGVLHPDDARLAAEHGAKGVVVSNHGGRQLDGALSGIDALPDVVEVADQHGLEVLVDGGFRRGTDVLMALGLGAKAVLLGRPIIWGLAVDGEAGATKVLDMLKAEFDVAMALAGCPTVADIPRDLVVRV